MSRARPVIAALLLAVVAAAGCGGEAEPAAEPQPTPAAPEDTRFEVPEPMPPEAVRNPSPDDAGRFGRYFFAEELPYVFNTGFTMHYRRFTHQGCVGCRAVMKEAERYNKGDSRAEIMQPVVKVRRVSVLDVLSGTKFFRVRLSVYFPLIVLKPADGEEERIQPQAPLEHILFVASNYNGWMVYDWGLPGGRPDSELV